MPYDKHMEFAAPKTDVHPQTGESKSRTVIDAYFYPDRIELRGWGTSARLIPMTREQLIGEMADDGFQCIAED